MGDEWQDMNADERQKYVQAMLSTVQAAKDPITPRDLFIAAAIAGLLAAPDTDFGYDELAKRAILQADAVMKARAR